MKNTYQMNTTMKPKNGKNIMLSMGGSAKKQKSMSVGDNVGFSGTDTIFNHYLNQLKPSIAPKSFNNIMDLLGSGKYFQAKMILQFSLLLIQASSPNSSNTPNNNNIHNYNYKQHGHSPTLPQAPSVSANQLWIREVSLSSLNY